VIMDLIANPRTKLFADSASQPTSVWSRCTRFGPLAALVSVPGGIVQPSS